MPRPLHRRALTRRRRTRLLAAALLLATAAIPASTERSHLPLAPVAARDLAAGHRIEPGDVRREHRASGTGPDGAIDDPVGRVVRQTILAGETFPAARLGGDGGALSERLEHDERALLVPMHEALPPAGAGDRLQLVVRAAEGASSSAGAARVLAADDDGLLLAVPAALAGEVGAAVGDGTLVVLVAPPP